MNTIIIICLIAGIAYLALFNKPKSHSTSELKMWFSSKLTEISENLEGDIIKDSNGEYPHSGKQSFEKQGTIIYLLLDKNYARFDISDKCSFGLSDILKTDGYKELDKQTRNLNLTLRLEENNVEGDEVETFDVLDEYIDDFPRYYTVTISGW